MKHTIFVCLFFVSFLVNAQDSLNMNKIGGWKDSNPDTYYNDVWGYTAPNGREYAILGSNHSTHFIDITDSIPIEINSFEGNDVDVIWRDFKVYKNYAYGVADGGDNSLQIFDLSDLPSNVSKIYDSKEFTNSTHNIFIDNDRLYLASNLRNGTNYALEVLSLEDPENPFYLGYVPSAFFGGNKVHDIYVKNDTAFCSGEYAGQFIMDLTNLNSPKLISSITTYPDQGYNHSSWVSEDGRTLVMADEVPNSMALKLFDISDIKNPTYLTKFVSNQGARPHNPFFKQGKIIISYYYDGVQVFDATNPSSPSKTAFYDTYPNNDTITGDIYPDDFDGCWGVFPYFKSGKIIASDVTYGLFVLTTPEIKSTVGVDEIFENTIELFPNPTSNKIIIRNIDNIESIEIYDMKGALIISNKGLNKKVVEINLEQLNEGNYIIKTTSNNKKSTNKIIIKK